MRHIEKMECQLKKLIVAVFGVSALAVTAGCSTFDPQDYSYSETRSIETVSYGTIESIRPVRINEDHAAIGTAAGAVLGGLLGNTMFHGNGRAASTVVGAVAGGAGGNALEHGITAQNGDEIIVRLDDGQTIAVVQGAVKDFEAGQRVRVITSAKGSRVERA